MQDTPTPTPPTLITKVDIMQLLVDSHEKRIARIEELLITGTDDKLPLMELVRNLTNSVQTYFDAKEAEEKKKQASWDRIRGIVYTVVITAVITFFAQATVFFVRIYPLLMKMLESS